MCLFFFISTYIFFRPSGTKTFAENFQATRRPAAAAAAENDAR